MLGQRFAQIPVGPADEGDEDRPLLGSGVAERVGAGRSRNRAGDFAVVKRDGAGEFRHGSTVQDGPGRGDVAYAGGAMNSKWIRSRNWDLGWLVLSVLTVPLAPLMHHFGLSAEGVATRDHARRRRPSRIRDVHAHEYEPEVRREAPDLRALLVSRADRNGGLRAAPHPGVF